VTGPAYAKAMAGRQVAGAQPFPIRPSPFAPCRNQPRNTRKKDGRESKVKSLKSKVNNRNGQRSGFFYAFFLLHSTELGDRRQEAGGDAVEATTAKRYNKCMGKGKKDGRPKVSMRDDKRSNSLRENRIVNVANGFREAREWEIQQELSMTASQRQRVAKALKERFYGKNAPDVREAQQKR